MRKIYSLLVLLTVLIFSSSCNDEWKDEQFERYVSFKAPINSKGVTPIYIRYNPNGNVIYKLPLIVSGSTTNEDNLNVHVAVDRDTLTVMNYERFQNRQDLYYKELGNQFFTIPETVDIKSGENTALMDVNFNLKDIDLVEKWILPLTILDNSSYNYTANPRKHYKKALLSVVPFNDYSGVYSGTAMKVYEKGKEDDAAIVKSEINTYVVDDNTIFFYAGTIDENRIDRRKYKIKAVFNLEYKSVIFTAEDPNINFTMNKECFFRVTEQMDATRPYLLHRYITITGIDYYYTDYTAVPGATLDYAVKGSLILERKINTQIPDEDQAIEW